MSNTHNTKETVQDTIISVIIAFALAFVFRGFVVEAFVIPTGSMAPTLDGAHETIRSPQSGYVWDVGPWDDAQNPAPVQAPGHPVTLHDPMTGETLERRNVPLMSGDRILVLKYLYSIMAPQRYDVIVFKNPANPQENFIKRLIGLGGDQLALIDGDVFVRHPAPGAEGAEDAWSLPGWKIERKPARAQRAVWQKIFDSDYAPLAPSRDNRLWYNPPWTSKERDWKIDGRVYEYSSSAPTELGWDSKQLRFRDSTNPTGEPWDIDDRYPYDEGDRAGSRAGHFFVSDLRMSAGIRPGVGGSGKPFEVRATITARSHQFQAELSGSTATLRMRAEPTDSDPDPAWSVMATGSITPLRPGAVANVEFWHADQALQLYVEGKLIVRAEYDWSPAERIRFATGRSIGELLTIEKQQRQPNIFATQRYTDPTRGITVETYRQARVAWTFSGAPVTLYRVALDRDLHYQPVALNSGPARATHPSRTVVLNPDQFFVCGDNSPSSSDSRFWGDAAAGPDPWSGLIDPTPGIVPRKLLLGKAFFVYFPSILKDGPVPVPDFGRMRFIW